VHYIIDYICLNTGYSVSLIDRQFLLRNLPKVQIHKMATLINVRGIGANKHQTNEYVILLIYLPSRCAKEEVIAITSPREIHIINQLRAQMLIGNNILQPKKIDILTSSSTTRISSYSVTIPIELKAKGSRSITHLIHAVATIVMPLKSTTMIPVHSIKSLPSRRDLFFEPEDSGLSLYTHLIDSSLSSVLAKNDSENKVRIPRNLRLGHIFKADFNNYLYITSGVEDAADLAIRTPRRQHHNN